MDSRLTTETTASLRTFLETAPLYKKAGIAFSDQRLYSLGERFPAVCAECAICGGQQTFRLADEHSLLNAHHFWMALRANRIPSCVGPMGSIRPEDNVQHLSVRDEVTLAAYICTSCNKEGLYYAIKFLGDMDVMKIGQWPPWSIAIPKPVAKAIGDHQERYKHGLICESQGYGIELLDSVAETIPEGEGRDKYLGTLARTRQGRVAQDKIDVVKDLLPPSLKPDGMNPLGVMHHALSEGLHALDDDECLNIAAQLRTALEFFISQIDAVRSSRKEFTDSMRKLLEKKQ